MATKVGPGPMPKKQTLSLMTCMVIQFKKKQMFAQDSLKGKLSHGQVYSIKIPFYRSNIN